MGAQAKTAAGDGVDGIIDLPAGKIATVATYLEIGRDEAPEPGATPPGLSFDRLGGDLRRYRRLYAAVGERWLWFSRNALPDVRLRTVLADPKVEALALVAEGRDIGFLELDFRQPDVCEVAFLGLVPDAIGRGLGQVLIGAAIGRGFARPVRSLWLHTCTLDHPAALAFYMRAGFRPVRRAVEIADDPRLAGHLPRDAAPGYPLL